MATTEKNKNEGIEVGKQLYSVRELCVVTGKCYRTIHRRIQEGKIGPVVRLGASLMIPKRVVERILEKGF
jgi:predicted site-specific integrase-resolvase